MANASGSSPRVVALVLLLLGPVLAGCFAPAHDPEPTQPPVTPPAPPPPTAAGASLLFDGERAYALALAQMYEDPANLSGPRYRIPGSTTTDEVAAELLAELEAALVGSNATVTQVDFTGVDYYGLDHRPVQPWVCGPGDPARARVQGITFHNIVARTHPTEIGLIVGAHYDSKQGADARQDPEQAGEPILAGDDGAASAGAVIELARVLAANNTGMPMTYVLFDGEDGFASEDCHPLAGSLHYAQSLTDAEVASARGMILFDMIGNASATFYREGNSLSYTGNAGSVDSTWLGDIIWGSADALDVKAFSPSRTSAVVDDHLSFLERGIPSVDIIRFNGGFAPYWHSTRDDHTAIQPEGIEQVGRVVEHAVHLLAGMG